MSDNNETLNNEEIKATNRNIVNQLKDRAENTKASEETGFINEKTGSSVRLDGKGNITIAASQSAQYKMQYATGKATEISMESNTITNRKNITTDEIIVNKHKMNPQFYELTDMKRYLNDPTQAIGNLTVCTTVLVKAWEPTLQKWVLIRRPMRTPLFSNMLNLPDSPTAMNMEDNISDYIQEMRKSENEVVIPNIDKDLNGNDSSDENTEEK